MALPSYVTFKAFLLTLLAPECQTLNREFFRRAITLNPIYLLNFFGLGVLTRRYLLGPVQAHFFVHVSKMAQWVPRP